MFLRYLRGLDNTDSSHPPHPPSTTSLDGWVSFGAEMTGSHASYAPSWTAEPFMAGGSDLVRTCFFFRGFLSLELTSSLLLQFQGKLSPRLSSTIPTSQEAACQCVLAKKTNAGTNSTKASGASCRARYDNSRRCHSEERVCCMLMSCARFVGS